MEEQRLETLLRHIKNVRENTEILGERLIAGGEEQLGRELIANGLIHDNSKLRGIEWLYLHQDVKDKEPELFKAAYEQHVTSPLNRHHPEAWVNSIQEMDRLHLAEMICDVKARSSEFGDNIHDWLKDKATKKWKFSLRSLVYRELKDFLDMLVEPKFS